jgi:hypothetical protein
MAASDKTMAAVPLCRTLIFRRQPVIIPTKPDQK